MNPVERTARKRHLCNFCELPIEPGTRYSYERLTPWDHPDNEGYGTWRAHLACREFWNATAEDWDEYEFDAADFREQMADAKERAARDAEKGAVTP